MDACAIHPAPLRHSAERGIEGAGGVTWQRLLDNCIPSLWMLEIEPRHIQSTGFINHSAIAKRNPGRTKLRDGHLEVVPFRYHGRQATRRFYAVGRTGHRLTIVLLHSSDHRVLLSAPAPDTVSDIMPNEVRIKTR